LVFGQAIGLFADQHEGQSIRRLQQTRSRLPPSSASIDEGFIDAPNFGDVKMFGNELARRKLQPQR
jgi:hypothetical protein